MYIYVCLVFVFVIRLRYNKKYYSLFFNIFVIRFLFLVSCNLLCKNLYFKSVFVDILFMYICYIFVENL